MRIGARVFLAFTLFFFVVSTAYGFITGFTEWVGFLGLLLCGLMALMISFYLHQTTKHAGRVPEDDPRGDVHEGAGDVGIFAPYSWWPLPLAAGAALGFTALAIGHWIFVGAGIFVVIGLFGWVYEFSMGQHAH